MQFHDAYAKRRKRVRSRRKMGDSRNKKKKSNYDFEIFLKGLDNKAEFPDPIGIARKEELEKESGDCFDAPVDVCGVCGMFPNPGSSCKEVDLTKFVTLSNPLKRVGLFDDLLINQHKFPDIKNVDACTLNILSDVWVCPLGIDGETGA